MIKRQYPTTAQAGIVYFITILATFAGSVILMPVLKIGTNLWINEFAYILFPPLLLAGIHRWSLERTYRYKRASRRDKLIGILTGICAWFLAFYVAKIIGSLLDNGVGIVKAGNDAVTGTASPNQQILLLIGMVVLAPICEETLFRGFIQRACESWSRKYGFVAAAVLFGIYHTMNGLSDILPATVLGLALGYLVYRTGSISVSMLAHAANNICALFLGGLLGNFSLSSMPIWLHMASLASPVAVILLLRGLKDEKGDDPLAEPQPTGRFSRLGGIFVILAVVILALIGIAEIGARAGKIG